jgi:membrane protein implicated in regulation of membrane protease activity
LGEVLDFAGGDIDLDGDLDFDMDATGADGFSVSPLKPACIAAFITVFGGAGMLALPVFGSLFSLMLSSLLGLIVAFLIYRFVIVPLHKAQNTSAVEKQSLIGQNATVTEKIPQGQFGKIT